MVILNELKDSCRRGVKTLLLEVTKFKKYIYFLIKMSAGTLLWNIVEKFHWNIHKYFSAERTKFILFLNLLLFISIIYIR